MILSQDLKKLIVQLPDGVEVYVYEGERSGLRLIKGNETGWIEIGEGFECDTTQHDIQEFRSNKKLPAPYCMKCGKEMIVTVDSWFPGTSVTTVAYCTCCGICSSYLDKLMKI